MIAPEVSVPAAEPQQVSAAHMCPIRVPVRMIGEAFRTFILFESGDTLIRVIGTRCTNACCLTGCWLPMKAAALRRCC